MASSPGPRQKSWTVVSGLGRDLGVMWRVWGPSGYEVKDGDVAPISSFASRTVVPMAELENEE